MGVKIYPAEKVDTESDCPSYTRKMTLDSSAKTISYDKLEKEYDEYGKKFDSSLMFGKTLNEIAEENGLDKEKTEALRNAVIIDQQYFHPDSRRDKDTAWARNAAVLGGNEKADSLVRDFEKRQKNKRMKYIEGIGSYAAAKGYDAVVCSNYGRTIVVLNRTKLILSDEHVEVPREEAS